MVVCIGVNILFTLENVLSKLFSACNGKLPRDELVKDFNELHCCFNKNCSPYMRGFKQFEDLYKVKH